MLPIKLFFSFIFFLFILCFFIYEVKKIKKTTDLLLRLNYDCLTRFSRHIYKANYAIRRNLLKKKRLSLHLLLFILLMVYLMTANEDADSIFYSFAHSADHFTNVFCCFYIHPIFARCSA